MTKIYAKQLLGLIITSALLISCQNKTSYKLVTAAGSITCSLNVYGNPQCFRYVSSKSEYDESTILPDLELDVLGVPKTNAKSTFTSLKAKQAQNDGTVRVCGTNQNQQITACWDYHGPNAYAKEVQLDTYAPFTQAVISDFGDLYRPDAHEHNVDKKPIFPGLCYAQDKTLTCVNTETKEPPHSWQFEEAIKKILVDNVIIVQTTDDNVHLVTMIAGVQKSLALPGSIDSMASRVGKYNNSIQMCVAAQGLYCGMSIEGGPLVLNGIDNSVTSISGLFVKTATNQLKIITINQNDPPITLTDTKIPQKSYQSFAANALSLCAIETGSTELHCYRTTQTPLEELPVP